MNARSLRRLAGDHASLHTSPLPPNYLLDPSQSEDDSSDLTVLDILLAGPTSTPYESGVFKLHLSIPDTYPNDPPKAFFRTKIFHPNVDDATGAVCLETLKRDWDPKLTLRDILITINCLLLQPNPSSALNAEAGMLLEQGDDGWTAFERRAKFMTKLHAGIPRDWKEAVAEAQSRGEEKVEVVGAPKPEAQRQDSGVDFTDRRRGRRRRTEKATPVLQRMDQKDPGEPSKLMTSTEKRPFVVQAEADDVFRLRIPPPPETPQATDDDEMDYDQENGCTTPPSRIGAPVFQSPVRQGPAVPLGELSISDDSFEAEYPPSPKKSPQKQRVRQDTQQENNINPERAEFNRPATRNALFTPQGQTDSDLSLFTIRRAAHTPQLRRSPRRQQHHDELESSFIGKVASGGVTKKQAPSSGKSAEERRKERLEAKMWKLCGEDVDAWNRGDFGGFHGLGLSRW
ncbi:hypothetical protein MBLNU457_5711t1 [Dothideomycetes sp. NU457]